MSQEWKQDTCGCMGDMETCACGTFCAPCLVYRNAEDLGKGSPLLCCLAACFFPCLPIFLLRGDARERYGIEGNLGSDALMSVCCTACVNCQTGAEINQRGDHK